MKKYISPDRLTKSERETILIFSEEDNKWYADTTVAKHRTRFLRKGWEQTSETTLEDGTFVAAEFEAPAHAISIKNFEKTVREYTDEQRQAMADRLRERLVSSKS